MLLAKFKNIILWNRRAGGEYSRLLHYFQQKSISASHLTATQDKFVEGEATIIELSGVYKRYHAPMARTILLGKPDQLKIDTMKNYRGSESGIDAVTWNS